MGCVFLVFRLGPVGGGVFGLVEQVVQGSYERVSRPSRRCSLW